MNNSTLCVSFASLGLGVRNSLMPRRKDAKKRKAVLKRAVSNLLIVFLYAIVCSLNSSALASTQTASSRVEGVVRDQTGAGIWNAEVSLSVASSAVARTT